MFALILTIVAIALVALLAYATLFYGIDISSKGVSRAALAKFLNEGNQLAGAFELYRADHGGVLPEGTAEEIKTTLLNDKYLAEWPDARWSLAPESAVRSDITPEYCTALNKSLGIETIPTCDDPQYLSRRVCCSGPADGS